MYHAPGTGRVTGVGRCGNAQSAQRAIGVLGDGERSRTQTNTLSHYQPHTGAGDCVSCRPNADQNLPRPKRYGPPRSGLSVRPPLAEARFRSVYEVSATHSQGRQLAAPNPSLLDVRPAEDGLPCVGSRDATAKSQELQRSFEPLKSRAPTALRGRPRPAAVPEQCLARCRIHLRFMLKLSPLPPESRLRNRNLQSAHRARVGGPPRCPPVGKTQANSAACVAVRTPPSVLATTLVGLRFSNDCAQPPFPLDNKPLIDRGFWICPTANFEDSRFPAAGFIHRSGASFRQMSTLRANRGCCSMIRPLSPMK